MNWKKYIHKNSSSEKYYADCQLVTAVNAYYHLTGKTIKQDSEQYKQLAELAGCCYGSCINIKRVWKELGIWEDKRFQEWDYVSLDKFLKQKKFIEINIWYKRYGLHSSAIVDYCKKTEAVRITNFKYETSINGWIFLEDLKPFLCVNKDGTKPQWHLRTFKRKK